MVNFTIVQNPRQRSINYRDGQSMSVGYEFFDQQAYTNAKAWLDRHNIKYHDQGFSGGGFDVHSCEAPLHPHVIVTSYTNKDSLFVFEHLDEAEPCRMCVIASGMVDVIEE